MVSAEWNAVELSQTAPRDGVRRSSERLRRSDMFFSILGSVRACAVFIVPCDQGGFPASRRVSSSHPSFSARKDSRCLLFPLSLACEGRRGCSGVTRFPVGVYQSSTKSFLSDHAVLAPPRVGTLSGQVQRSTSHSYCSGGLKT